MKKAKVSQRIAEALNELSKDEWSKQYHLIAHCKSFSGNGVRMKDTFIGDFEPLNDLDPLTFATCLLVGYEVEQTA